MITKPIAALTLAAALLIAPAAAFAQSGGSATGATAGSAAAGGTSASTLGSGGTSTGPSGTGSSLATGGSAAGGKTMDRSKVDETGNGLNGQAKAMAHDGGTFSKSHTQTKVQDGASVNSRTKTMSNVPGEKPVKSTTSTGSSIGQ
jgi:hypothetical protein